MVAYSGLVGMTLAAVHMPHHFQWLAALRKVQGQFAFEPYLLEGPYLD